MCLYPNKHRNYTDIISNESSVRQSTTYNNCFHVLVVHHSPSLSSESQHASVRRTIPVETEVCDPQWQLRKSQQQQQHLQRHERDPAAAVVASNTAAWDFETMCFPSSSSLVLELFFCWSAHCMPLSLLSLSCHSTLKAEKGTGESSVRGDPAPTLPRYSSPPPPPRKPSTCPCWL
jgi:hypothetical protein